MLIRTIMSEFKVVLLLNLTQVVWLFVDASNPPIVIVVYYTYGVNTIPGCVWIVYYTVISSTNNIHTTYHTYSLKIF